MSLLLQAQNISKSFGEQELFKFDTLEVFSGDKIGIVGANGNGKTTLLNILSQRIKPDTGYVKSFTNISYLTQFASDNLERINYKRLSKYNVSEHMQFDKISGGQQTRLKIASKLDKNQGLVFADEPTTNLDTSGVELVLSDLLSIQTLLLISHDRNLLDSVCNRTISIENNKLYFFSGNYSNYLVQKEARRDRQQFEYQQYLDTKERLTKSIQSQSQKANKMTKAPKRMGISEARLHKGSIKDRQQKAHSGVRQLKHRLDSLEAVDAPDEILNIQFDFSLTKPPNNKVIAKANNLNFSYNDNVIFSNTRFSIPNNSKTCLYGSNGCGKSTLLNLIASKNHVFVAESVNIGYFHQNLDNLDYQSTVLENAMKDSVQIQSSVRTILARLLFNRQDIHKKVSALSGGERVKLSLCKLFVGNYNVLLIDEPTNHLDILAVESFEKMLKQYPGTVIFASHDSSLVNTVATRLLLFENNKLTSFEGTLKEYEHSILQKEKPVVDKLVYQMRLADIASRLDDSTLSKEKAKKLNEQYVELSKQLRKL